jgi:formate hydrogenlyase subunit 6/NADH:ubiquinone oxidoreductase subunit I
MLSPQETEERILKATEQIPSVVAAIQSGRKLTSRHVFLFETLITVPFNPVWSKLKLRAKDFHTTEKCIGCGKCVKVCPLNNIALQNKKPLWGDHCTHCMACICNCPTEAIEYGTISQGKEKYNFGKYSYVVKETSTPKS